MKHAFTCLILVLLALGNARAQGFFLYGLGTVTGRNTFGGNVGDQALVLLNSMDGSSLTTSPVRITGVAAGQRLVGMDYRPANNLLYALGYNDTLQAPGLNAQLYILTPGTNSVAAVGGPLRLELGGPTERFSFDFNPVADQARVLSTNDANYRLDPVAGTLAGTDATLAYVAATPPNPTNPGVNSAAYSNSFAGALSTTLYTIDYLNNGLFSILSPPNAGTLTPQATMLVTIPSGPSAGTYGIGSPGDLNLDIYYNAATGLNEGFMTEVTNPRANGARASNLYTVNLTTGAARLLGNTVPASAAFNFEVRDVAVSPAPAPPLVWNGSVSTAWTTAANWTPAAVPTAANDVTIPGGTPRQPLITQPQAVRNFTISGGGMLSLPSGGFLLVGGSFANNGGSLDNTGTGAVVLNLSTSQTLGGTSATTFQNLIVGGVAGTATATLTGPVAVRGLLTLYGNLVVGSQRLTLVSDAAGTAQVHNTGGAVLGNAVVQRYIEPSLNPGPGYRHYSAPVSGSTVADLAAPGYVPVLNNAYNGSPVNNSVTPFPNIFGYEQSRVLLPANSTPAFDQGWFCPNSTGERLTVTEGFTVNIGAGVTVDFEGPLNNGNLTSPTLGRGANAQSGWHLRGNPYPSPLDWQLMLDNGRLSGVEPALYVYKSSGQYTGAYASYVNGVGANGGGRVLPLAQGFFVRTAPGQNGALSFTNAERLTTPANPAFQRGSADTRTRLTLALSGAGASLQTVAYFDDHALPGYDAASDAAYLPAANGLLLSIEVDDEALSISGLPTLTDQPVQLPLRLAAAVPGTYTLAVEALENLPANYRAFLRDAATGTLTDLATTPTITLALSPGDPESGRYTVLITPTPPTPQEPTKGPATQLSLYPNPAHGMATLLLPAALRGTAATEVQIIDKLGRTVLRRTLAAGPAEALELPLNGLAPGIYAVLAHTTAGPISRRLVVE